MPNWPLAQSFFTIADKLRIGAWLLTNDRWTTGEEIPRYEKRWEDYTECRHAIMVNSGSSANELIALRRKHELMEANIWPQCNGVVFPAVTWISSISPWVNLGFRPIFMDVGENMCSTYENLNVAFMQPNIAAVFYTSMLGFTGGLHRIRAMCFNRNIPLYLDNCESSFSFEQGTHLCNYGISSTSFYYSHHTTGGQEGGMVFCHEDRDADYFRMLRNHGMTRGMPAKYHNPDADEHFDFYLLGSNFRTTNLLAYMASLDLKRAIEYAPERRRLARRFSHCLSPKLYEKPHDDLQDFVPLALPILAHTRQTAYKVRSLLKAQCVEYRPIISGNLLRHTAFKPYGNPADFPRAEFIHENGCYVGIHPRVTDIMIEDLCWRLNHL